MKKLFIIGSPTVYNHPSDYVKQTVLQLACQDNVVIVVSRRNAPSFKKLFFSGTYAKYFIQSSDKKNVYFFNLIHFFPFIRFRLVKNINLFANYLFLLLFTRIKKWNRYRKYLWLFHYSYYDFPKIFGNSWISLYDCVEYPFSHNPIFEKQIRMEEIKLINSVNYFFVNSPTLKNLWIEKKPIIVKQGFDLKSFRTKTNENKLFYKIPNNKPIIGYIGGINYRLDFKMIDKLIQENSQLIFVFMGTIEKFPQEDLYTNTDYWIKKIHTYRNVYFIGNKSRKYVSQMIKRFDVCLIPYNIENKFNYYSITMKSYEYFYFGKPVVSTPILESIRLSPPMFIAKNTHNFSRIIKEIIKNGLPNSYAKKEKLLAIENCWENKINEINKYISS